jgi:hypothetical protein
MNCPERVIEKPIPQPVPLEIGEVEDAPPLTTAALPEEVSDRDAIRALVEDLLSSREWGWTLYHKLMNTREALERLREETDGIP